MELIGAKFVHINRYTLEKTRQGRVSNSLPNALSSARVAPFLQDHMEQWHLGQLIFDSWVRRDFTSASSTTASRSVSHVMI